MDEALIRIVNNTAANPGVAAVGIGLSSRWMLVLVCVPMLVVLTRQRRWVAIVTIAMSMGVSDLVVARVLKPAFARERPCRTLPDLQPVAPCGVGKSFPSGHATTAFTFLFAAAPTVRLGWGIFTPLAIGVAGSRVLLGVHYPTDIIAGALLGSLLGGLAWGIRIRFEPKRL